MARWLDSRPQPRLAAPREAELQALVERLAARVGRLLERQGLLVRDTENDFLEFGPAAGGAMDDLIGHSIRYRVAVGPRAGQKVFALQTVPAREAAVAESHGVGLNQFSALLGESPREVGKRRAIYLVEK